MANEEQLSILRQGVDNWNQWRKESPGIEIELDNADLSRINLSKVNLGKANLRNTDLIGTDLSEADLSEARFFDADLTGANLRGTNLREAHLSGANLSFARFDAAKINGAIIRGADLTGAELIEVDLKGADLSMANLRDANLQEANLTKADLTLADLSGANLSGSRFTFAQIGGTFFASTNLAVVVDLENVIHAAPSSIGIEAISKSKGKIPEVFLRGCGLSNLDITYSMLYNPDLSNEEINKIVYKIYDLRATQPIQISPLFISYSHADSAFVDKVETHLNKKGIRFWRDIQDMKSGKMEKQIDRGMRLNPTVLLILSNASLQSDWVEHEVRTARSLEKEMKKDILCPVALDDSWKNSPWAKRIMEQIMEYNILDFSEWKDDTKFESAFNKLIDGLELFYK